MIFSSMVFIFAFLPIVLFVYSLGKRIETKNYILLIFSLLFYAWGEPLYIFLLIGSTICNWRFGMLVSAQSAYRKVWLKIAIIFNVAILFIFKYLGFIVENISLLLNTHYEFHLALPIGISFFTFQSMSYVIDIYRGKGEAQTKFYNVALYIAFFPQLIAGPIVRYETIVNQMNNRRVTIDVFTDGIRRFISGLGKKVIFANNFAIVADAMFAENIPAGGIWLGAVAYTLQILFDFSGYSDMAIGLGKMFGFSFDENFDYPYISKSITEFWRRWHISLGIWFRDYVYIPLGGNRVSKKRHILNLFIVWALTGLWHGANWTFVVWGLMFFLLLSIEKFTGLNKYFENKLKIIPHIYTMFFIVIGWIIFRAENITIAGIYISHLFAFTSTNNALLLQYVLEYGFFFVIVIPFLVPRTRLCAIVREHMVLQYIRDICYVFIFLLSVSFIVKGSYNPFIYFNF